MVTVQIALVYGVLLGAVALWASDRIRMDLVGVLALLALALTGILSPAQALAGFSDPVVLMIAGLFVVGEGLFRTGVAQAIGGIPARVAGDSEVRLLAAIMLMVALMSAFMSSTGTVAIMLPAVVGLAWDRGIPPSRLLIPLAVASLLGGMLTLIGTPPNIVVSNHLAAMGREPFHFFSFTPVGLVMLVIGVAFMVLVGRRLLPERPPPRGESRPPDTSVAALSETYGLAGTLFSVRVRPDSPVVGRSIEDLQIRKRYDVNVVGIAQDTAARDATSGRGRTAARGGVTGAGGAGGAGGAARGPLRRLRVSPDELRPAPPSTRFRAGDVVYLQGLPRAVAGFVGAQHLELLGEEEGGDVPEGLGLVEVLLTPGSRLLGKSIEESEIRETYRVTVLSIRRMGEPILENLGTVQLRFGDTLLVKGAWDRINALQREQRDFVVTGVPRELDRAVRPYHRAPLAVGILLVMMGLMTFNVVAPVLAVLAAAAAMVLSGCVGGDEAYRSINWRGVVLIASVLPIATALEVTGGMALIVTGLGGVLDQAGPLVLLASLFILTSAMSQVISNTATAVLLAPIAFQLAVNLGARPEPFLMGIAVAASTAFATPIASPVNTLVLGPGGYRFGDFFKIGVSLQLLLLVATLVVVPLLFPF
jgi:di/tricarboxylate transporter